MNLICLALPMFFIASPTDADADLNEAMRLLNQDPPIADVQRAALEHFTVSHDDISSYRAAARLRALLPAITGGYTQDDGKDRRASTDRAQFPYEPTNPQITDDTNKLGRTFTASATWTLGGLVFDSNQLEAYTLVGIHEDVLKEVTRLYYTRQHNILALAIDPPKDPRAKAALMLRTREIEAMLDAMTGGEWSKMRKK